uniref:Uncharacterized protein n=1 Tax=Panagrellus redivivus TaxID=6233 RepID=A0A7E4VLT0_PANRE
MLSFNRPRFSRTLQPWTVTRGSSYAVVGFARRSIEVKRAIRMPSSNYSAVSPQGHFPDQGIWRPYPLMQWPRKWRQVTLYVPGGSCQRAPDFGSASNRKTYQPDPSEWMLE